MSADTKGMSQSTKSIMEMLPLVAFFAAYLWKGMLWATGVLVAVTLIVSAVIYSKTGKLSKQQIITVVLVAFFGALTLYFKDPAFLKLKVTIINALFGVVLFCGLWFNRLFLSDLLGEAIEMPQPAWRTLTIRWGLFFFAMAALNQIIWFNFSDATWVGFKTFGLLGLTMVFAIANAPYMMKHMQQKDQNPSADG
jgi:intracellular septation protein